MYNITEKGKQYLLKFVRKVLGIMALIQKELVFGRSSLWALRSTASCRALVEGQSG